MARLFHVFLISILLTFSSAVIAVDGAKKDAAGNKLGVIWDEWDAFLKEHVDPKNGRVAYDKVDYAALEAHLKRYESLDPKGWDDGTRKAAYINFYWRNGTAR